MVQGVLGPHSTHFTSIRPSNGESARFGQVNNAHNDVFQTTQHAPSLAQRQKATVEAANALLNGSKDASQQAKVVQGWLQTKGIELQIFDGNQPEQDWVNQTTRMEGGALAFHRIPETLMYSPEQLDAYYAQLKQADSSQKQDKISDFPPEYLQACQFLDQKKQLGIFISKGCTVDDVRHELFHALQFAHGLPSCASSPQHVQAAQAHRDKLTQPVFQSDGYFAKLGNSVVYALKLMGTWLAVMPYLLLRRGYENLTGRYKDRDLKQSPGEDLRTLMAREAEVSKYMMHRSMSTHFNFKTFVGHANYYLSEVIPQTVRSYALDTQWSQSPS